ncbi:peroxiredoxin HYR1 [Drechslerella stenobrocha 248]|uniref:Glutathione peroxidase n=1 Tax=Drechslerella stenobrocha 248 TaxID=1043628 RepID=W7IC06_9PEZI|nr:peroxiredoxin HYR1 [Drechslerella stenobrocha 248]
MASATELGFYSYKPLDKKGEPFNLGDLKGKVVLVVNVASKCGLTPQYEGLEKLHEKYNDRGFVVLGFPCNQFMGQAPGTAEEEATFCSLTYGVKFPVLGKIDVNGKNAHPLYEWLKHTQPGILGLERMQVPPEDIKWNFEKFLIGRDGSIVNRWAPTTEPAKLSPTIEQELAKSDPFVQKDPAQSAL